ncbi:Gfo/Idh/MocA family oxidoreductase [Tardisphaera miroshnichenkoae]
MKAIIIGCGGIANWAHLPNLKRLGVEIVATCDVIPERAEEAAKKFGGRALTDYEKALSLEADFALIATPPDTHREIAEAALASGKHVFLEKPLAADLSDARKLYEDTTRERNKLVPGLCLRFNPLFQYVESRLKQLGRLHYLYTFALGNASGLLGPSGWVREKKRSGGMMTENIIHMIDAFRWFAGEFDSVSAIYATFTPGSDIEDNVSASMRFESGAIGNITKSWTSTKSVESWGVVGEKGSIVVNGYVDGTANVDLRDRGISEAHSYQGGGESMYLDELKEFISYVKGEAGYPVSALDALRAQELSEAARLSSVQRREVSIDEVRG